MAKQELLATIRDRYRSSSKKDKSRILDEFIAVTGHHRKHGIRLLGKPDDDAGTTRSVRGRRIYDEAVRAAVIVIWEAADRICGKRLTAALPHLVESMERHGHLALDPEVREPVFSRTRRTNWASFAMTLDQRILYWGQGAREALGYASGTVLGRRCSEVPSGLDCYGLTAGCAEGCSCVRSARVGWSRPRC